MQLGTPILIINFKAYQEAIGEKAVSLAAAASDVGSKLGVPIVVCPQPTDILRIVQSVDIPVFAQHVDPFKPGKFTGHIVMEAVKEVGAVGTLISHSERRLPLPKIDKVIRRARELGMLSCVCAESASASSAVAALGPDYVAFEDPRLIGTGISVSTAKPEAVKESVKSILKVNAKVIPLCGAGITNGNDAFMAVELGSKGVLVASGIVKATNPKKAIMDIAEGLKRATS